jgi:DNA-binding response OmpR family regulator
VLDELWAFVNQQSDPAARTVALAHLALRLCRLYPRPTSNMLQRIALGHHVLEMHGVDAELKSDAVLGGTCIRMTRLEAALLSYLISNRGRIVSREELMNKVWQRHLTGTAARTVDIHVHRLRRKLGGEFAERLETVRNVGYTLSTMRSDTNVPNLQRSLPDTRV